MLTLFRLASDTCCGVASIVFEPSELQAKDLRLGDLGEHLGEPLLLQLKTRRSACRTSPASWRSSPPRRSTPSRRHRSPRYAVARLCEAHERGLEPARLRQQGVLGNAHVLQHQLAGVAGTQAELALLVLAEKPLVFVGTMKPRIEFTSSTLRSWPTRWPAARSSRW